ncbi:MAG TPA: hypothetical protein P5555_13335 [Candidatus Paceibacterota bacterium]|nr:hypothetical protein [Verrucomicrobiota bacterium]HRZ46167.1 hypothetical protein [Candidatus Paceibacterota bacterium]
MKMPPEILTRLLSGEHFNAEERKAIGLWPPETLLYRDVVEHLAMVLKSREWFPQSPEASPRGSAVREGIYVHREMPDRFVCIAQRSRADDPTVMAESTETVFRSPRDAAEYYLKWELNLPGRLDGWPVASHEKD